MNKCWHKIIVILFLLVLAGCHMKTQYYEYVLQDGTTVFCSSSLKSGGYYLWNCLDGARYNNVTNIKETGKKIIK